MRLGATLIIGGLLACLDVEAAPEQNAAGPGCKASAKAPFVYAPQGLIKARNSALCNGPVRDVTVQSELFQLAGSWNVIDRKAEKWGKVQEARFGSVDAFFAPGTGLCYQYTTRATVRWTFANGSPGASILYSKTIKLAANGRPCP